MTDCYPDPAAFPGQASERSARRLLWLLFARIVLAVLAVALTSFLFQWSAAVKREQVSTPSGQQVPEEWKVVIPQYAGGGRGSTLIALKPWRFGTMEEHPVQVGLCIALVVSLAGAFLWCTWCASRLKAQQ
jgi:hypothetical protein